MRIKHASVAVALAGALATGGLAACGEQPERQQATARPPPC